jgi:hypothetical protein
MAQWRPSATSNLDIGAGPETVPRRLIVQCENLGAGDTLKVAGRAKGAVAYQPLALTKQGTNAVVPGATGIVNDADTFEVDVGGMEVQLQYTKAANNPIVNFNEVYGT